MVEGFPGGQNRVDTRLINKSDTKLSQVWFGDYLKIKHVYCMTVRVGSVGEDCLKFVKTIKIQFFFIFLNATF